MKKKEMIKFEQQLAQAELQIAENSRAGLSAERSVLAVLEQSEQPLRGYLETVYNELNYSNLTLAEALNNMAKRSASNDARLLAIVVGVQQEAGTNLADALTFLNETIAARMDTRRKLRAALAESRLTRTVVAISPWAIFLALAFLPGIHIDGFLDFYLQNPIGWFVVLGCVAVEVMALLAMNKLMNIEID